MAEATAKPEAMNLSRMSQGQAARLIGKPAIWLRDNAHLVGDARNEDDSYDGPKLVAMLRSDFTAVELSNADFEMVNQLADSLGGELYYCRPALVRRLESIELNHGAPGMAAVGMLLMRFFKLQLESPAELEVCIGPTPEQINAAAAKKAAEQIAILEERRASRELKCVYVCGCGRYRWGRSWLKTPLPPGFFGMEGLDCPECRQKLVDAKKRRRGQSAKSMAEELKEFDNF